MSLIPGTRLGPYEILAPLGAGGMGEVYRAKDTRLGREVAIKVLAQHLSASPGVRARFEREARTVSSLNHPHICTLHDVGREGDVDFLVMELVDGETLADRLEHGALPTAEVLRLGAQIAEALDKAHRAQVIHRDLKPGNVMVTKSGAKLMDFGLARATELAEPVSGSAMTQTALSQSPTKAQPLTAEGTIVGTFQYIAPEQLEGKEADARADLWALGCVLYEMATGKRAFGGTSRASLISSIMKDTPRAMGEIAPASPPALDRLVRECLAKDPEQRIQSAHDVKLHLDWIRDAGAGAGTPAAVAAPRPNRERLAWIAALSVVTLGAALLIVRLPGSGPPPASLHLSIMPPAGVEFSSSSTYPMPLAISPDGTQVVFCAALNEGTSLLWVRPLDSPNARPLTGTDGGYSPFFSPDGRSIGFFAQAKLKRVDVAGGPVITLADALDPRGGSWGSDGTIIFTPASDGGVFQVAAEGGPATQATRLDSSLAEATHRYPSFLPGTRNFLYLARRRGSGSGEDPAIHAASLDSPQRTRVLGVASNVIYASGHLLYARDRILMCQPFDARRMITTGAATPLTDDLRWDERFSRGVFAASGDGVLAFMSGQLEARTQLQWVDRSGERLERVGEPADYAYGGTPMISPDGRQAAMTILNEDRGSSAVWIVDLETGRRRRLTLVDGDYPGCAWSADGQSLIVNRAVAEGISLVEWSLDGSAGRTLVSRPNWLWPQSTSPDKRFVLYIDDGGIGGGDLLAVSIVGTGSTIPVAAGPGAETSGQFSPDGRLVTYVSNESGRREIYVVTFPEPNGRWQVSQDGGDEPRFSRDGRELYFVDRQNRLMAVERIDSPNGFEAGAIRPLFQTQAIGSGWRYDVSPDGKRFLLVVPPEGNASSPVTIVTNWTLWVGKG